MQNFEVGTCILLRMKNHSHSVKWIGIILVTLGVIFLTLFFLRKDFTANKNIGTADSEPQVTQPAIDPGTVTGIYERGQQDLLVIESKVVGTSTDSDLYIIDYNVPPPASRILSIPAGKLSGTRATFNFDAAGCSAWYDFVGSEMHISPNAASCMAEPNLTGTYTKITKISPEQAITIVSNVPEVKKWLPRIQGNIDGLPTPYVDSITRDSYTIVVPGIEGPGNIIGRAPVGPYKVNVLAGYVVSVSTSQ